MKVVTNYVEKVCTALGVSDDYLRIFEKPNRSIIVNLPIRLDDGSLKMMKGYWVLHSSILGPGKGGFRIDNRSSLEDIQFLAQLMTWKCALLGLPLGGFKGSVQYDAKLLSQNEHNNVVRAYTKYLIKVLGPKTVIPSPNLNTNATSMAVMMDTYSMSVGCTTPGICTGKPQEAGGILGRNRAVGWGLAHIINDIVKKTGEKLKDKSLVIQGFGHVGKNIALNASNYGAKVVAISDTSTGLHNGDGLDINELIQYKQTHGCLDGYDKAEKIENSGILNLECDALVPCATQNQITKSNADNIHTNLVIEGANSPTTYAAEKILNERGITIIPDLIANSGGLIVSYFEWVQDLQALHWSLEQVSTELKKIILRTFNQVYMTHKDNKISYREAAYQIAIKRVISAAKYRGIYP